MVRKEQLEQLLPILTGREQKVLRLRFALGGDGATETLEVVGREFGVTRERVRCIQARALGVLGACVHQRYDQQLTNEEIKRILGYRSLKALREELGIGHRILKGLLEKTGMGLTLGHGHIILSDDEIGNLKKCLESMPCRLCGSPLPIHHRSLCSDECRREARKYMNWSEERKQRHALLVARWRREHLEVVREIERRSSRKRRQKPPPRGTKEVRLLTSSPYQGEREASPPLCHQEFLELKTKKGLGIQPPALLLSFP